MKIKKLKVQAAESLITTPVQSPEVTTEISISPEKYTDAINYVQSAINSLSCCAEGDECAKDAIANLAVVLFELKGC